MYVLLITYLLKSSIIFKRAYSPFRIPTWPFRSIDHCWCVCEQPFALTHANLYGPVEVIRPSMLNRNLLLLNSIDSARSKIRLFKSNGIAAKRLTDKQYGNVPTVDSHPDFVDSRPDFVYSHPDHVYCIPETRPPTPGPLS